MSGQQLTRQVGSHDGHLDIRIGDVVLQLLRPVHRVDRHHDCIGPQDAKVGSHPLQAVLHEQDHAIACLHTLRMQPGRHALCLRQQLGIGHHGIKAHQSGFVGVPQRADSQVVPQRRGWWCDGARQPGRPERLCRQARLRRSDGRRNHDHLAANGYVDGRVVGSNQVPD